MTNAQTTPEIQLSRIERRKARTRATILETASKLFREKGFEATSIQDIAELADTGVGTLYGYFPSKEDILREVLRNHAAQAVQQFRSSVSESAPALDRLCRALRVFAAYLRDNRTVLRAGFQAGVRTSRTEGAPSTWLVQACQQLIGEGIETGQMRKLPVDATVRMLSSTYTLAMLGIGTWHGHEDSPETLNELETIVRSLLTP